MDGRPPLAATPARIPVWRKLWERCRRLLNMRLAPLGG
jgi:hypothetical protein